MAIIVDRGTKLVVQGLTGSEGRFHVLRNRAYGTSLVAGVTPGKGGQDVEGVPVFDTVAEAVDKAGANTSLIFVPARFAVDAIYEAVDAGEADKAQETARTAGRLLDKAASKGVIHANQAANRKSAIAKRVSSLSA